MPRYRGKGGGVQSILRLAGMSATHKGAFMTVTCLLVHHDSLQRGWRWTFMAAEGRSSNTTVNMAQDLVLGRCRIHKIQEAKGWKSAKGKR